MIKAVLDTNLIVSAFLTPNGHPARILKAWQDSLFELIISPQIIEEMRRVLFLDKLKKYKLVSDEEINTFLLGLHNVRGFINPHKVLKVIEDDPDDDKFIIAAVEGKAEYIVSGDSHLKKLGSYQGIKIFSPVEFLKILG